MTASRLEELRLKAEALGRRYLDSINDDDHPESDNWLKLWDSWQVATAEYDLAWHEFIDDERAREANQAK